MPAPDSLLLLTKLYRPAVPGDADLEWLGVELWIARANGPLPELPRLTGLTERIGQDNLLPSIRAAVVAHHERFADREGPKQGATPGNPLS